MKVISFQRRDEGERFVDAAIVLWRLDGMRNGQQALRAFGIAVMLPFPVLSTYRELFAPGPMRGWRVPRVLAYCTRPRSGKWIPVMRAWMQEIGQQRLLATTNPTKQGAK